MNPQTFIERPTLLVYLGDVESIRSPTVFIPDVRCSFGKNEAQTTSSVSDLICHKVEEAPTRPDIMFIMIHTMARLLSIKSLPKAVAANLLSHLTAIMSPSHLPPLQGRARSLWWALTVPGKRHLVPCGTPCGRRTHYYTGVRKDSSTITTIILRLV